jgi:hypothetical protein
MGATGCAAWPVAGYARRRESGEWLRGEKHISLSGWFIVVGVMLLAGTCVKQGDEKKTARCWSRARWEASLSEFEPL